MTLYFTIHKILLKKSLLFFDKSNTLYDLNNKKEKKIKINIKKKQKKKFDLENFKNIYILFKIFFIFTIILISSKVIIKM